MKPWVSNPSWNWTISSLLSRKDTALKDNGDGAKAFNTIDGAAIAATFEIGKGFVLWPGGPAAATFEIIDRAEIASMLEIFNGSGGFAKLLVHAGGNWS
jgi:3-deoxy-D-manno-octulosonate 8-phosphate phosphatase KdsC-like HAD superfamily phosphatase